MTEGFFIFTKCEGERNTNPKRTFLLFAFVSAVLLAGYFVIERFELLGAANRLTGMQALPDGFKSHGIDVSHYQGDIEWELLFDNHPIDFVYCKVTEGNTLIDSKWKKNQSSLQSLQIKHGGYHFYIPDLSPIEQAKHFLANYSISQEDLPPVLDIETIGVSDEILVKDIKEWLRYVESETGRKPVIYAGYNMYRRLLKSEFETYKFWIANYADRPDRFLDPNIIHWQYNDHGKISGIDGAVDFNFSKIDFTHR